MPMNGTNLGNEIAAALESLGVLNPDESAADIEPIWQAIGNAVVSHIQSNAVVSTNTTGNGLATLPVQVVVATGTGATTAPDVITGTGTGTVA